MLATLKETVVELFNLIKENKYNDIYTRNYISIVNKFRDIESRRIIISSSLLDLIFDIIKKEPTNKVCILLHKLIKLGTLTKYDNSYILQFKKFNLLFKKGVKPIYIYLNKTKKDININYVSTPKITSIIKGFILKIKQNKNNYDPQQFCKIARVLQVIYQNTISYYVDNYSSFIETRNIGRFLTELFPKLKASEIGNFISIIERTLTTDSTNHKFKLVKGADISYYYNEINYERRSTYSELFENQSNNKERDTLNKSCMRGNGCGLQTEFYAMFPDKINLAILLNDNKLRARCLVWHADDGKTYFDRIFYVNENDYNVLFKKMEKLGYINCSNSNSSSRKDFEITFDTNLYELHLNMPYLDTVRYYYVKDNNIIFSTRYESGYIDYTNLDRRQIKTNRSLTSDWYSLMEIYSNYIYQKQRINESPSITIYDFKTKKTIKSDINSLFYYSSPSIVYDYNNHIFLYKNNAVYSTNTYSYNSPNNIMAFTLYCDKYIYVHNRDISYIHSDESIENCININYNATDHSSSVMSTYYGIRIHKTQAVYNSKLESFVFDSISVNPNVYRVAGCMVNQNERNRIKNEVIEKVHNKIKELVKTMIK